MFCEVSFMEKNTPTRNPKWSRDELILALDFYLEHRPSLPDKNTSQLQELSKTLNKLMNKLGHTGNNKYRNPNGVYMKLMNFLPFDSTYSGKGLSRGGKGDKEVWDSYADKPDLLKSIANNIKANISSDVGPALYDYDDLDEDEAKEGRLLTVVHKRRERNKKITQKKKETVLKRFGTLACEICNFDFSKVYGERGKDYIECHHTIPVHRMKEGDKTKLSDLALVCSNCHRMIHRKRQWLNIDELRSIIQDQ